jgi:hypothetical protein
LRIVFSRKGFDTAAGGGPSPIVDGRPLSLPIPAAGGPSRTTWDDLGLGAHVATASRGRWSGADLCHHDPMFLADGTCLFGQRGAAKTHLANQRVGAGDAFVFFGLFREAGGRPHQRIFGYLIVDEVIELASAAGARIAELAALGHPHALGGPRTNDAIYRGEGAVARMASEALRLTASGETPSVWQRPGWLEPGALTYHRDPRRWLPGGRLRTVSQGQEFVADIGDRAEPRRWLDRIVDEIRG